MLCELARRCRSAATNSADLDDDDPADTTVGAADLWTGSLLPQPADARVDATEQVEYRVVWLWGSGGALCRVGCDGVEGGRVGRRHHLFEQTLLRVDPPGSTHPLRTFVILSTLYQVGHGTGSVLYLALAVLKYYKKVTLGGRHFCRQVTMGPHLLLPTAARPSPPFPFLQTLLRNLSAHEAAFGALRLPADSSAREAAAAFGALRLPADSSARESRGLIESAAAFLAAMCAGHTPSLACHAPNQLDTTLALS